MEEKSSRIRKTLKITGLIAAAVITVVICILLIPYLSKLGRMNKEELNAALETADTFLRRLGPIRYILMALLQIFQMIFAPIPGGPVAVMMGFMFGPIVGTLLTIFSTSLGTMLIIWCVERFGMKFVNMFINSKGFDKLKFLHNPSGRDALLFLLFLIPGTPKDIITFFAPFTGARPRNIVVLASVARIPSIFLMVYLGDAISDGNLVKSAIILTIAAVIGLIGIIFKDKVMPERSEKKVVRGKDTFVFDLDGTLLNTLTDLTNAVNFALESVGYEKRTEDQVRKAVGNGIAKLVERSLPGGAKDPHFDEAFDVFKSYYGEHCLDNTRAYDGIYELIDGLKGRGMKLAVVSNKADFAVKELCSKLFGQIPVAIGESENVRKKPAPDSLIAAVDALGSTLERTVYIGDSDVDIQTAKNAGVGCISVTWGFRSAAFLSANNASTLVDDPSEILDAVDTAAEKEKEK